MSSRSAVTVRPLEPHEEEAFRRVARRSFGVLDSMFFSTRGDRALVAVLDDGEVVGGTVLRVVDAGERSVGVIDWVFADPERAPHGTGTALRDEALNWFDDEGVDEIIAAIEPMNTASEALHRGGGFEPVPLREEAARWRWAFLTVLVRAHLLIGTNLRVWLRPGASDVGWWRPRAWWTVTLPMAIALLVVVTLRSPRELIFDVPGLAWLIAIPLLLLGSREALLRLVARAHGRSALRHVPWSHGLVLGVALGVAFGTWLPLTGSSTPAPGGQWRADRELRWMLPAHLAGALPVAALAWVLVLTTPEAAFVPWPDVARAAVLLAFFDLVLPVDHFVGTTARLARDRSLWLWGVVAAIGVGPMALSLVG